MRELPDGDRKGIIGAEWEKQDDERHRKPGRKDTREGEGEGEREGGDGMGWNIMKHWEENKEEWYEV